MVKSLPAMQETRIQSLVWEVPLEKGMAIHSSTLACRIPWTEKPGGPSWGHKESHRTRRLTHTQRKTSRPVVLSPRHYCPLGASGSVWECFWVVTTESEMLLPSSGERPGIQLNILERTGQPPTVKNYLVTVEKLWSRVKSTVFSKWFQHVNFESNK